MQNSTKILLGVALGLGAVNSFRINGGLSPEMIGGTVSLTIIFFIILFVIYSVYLLISKK
jgi:hypothetical protein